MKRSAINPGWISFGMEILRGQICFYGNVSGMTQRILILIPARRKSVTRAAKKRYVECFVLFLTMNRHFSLVGQTVPISIFRIGKQFFCWHM